MNVYGQENLQQPAVYEIRIRGCMRNRSWPQWLEGTLVMVTDNGETVLYTLVTDQSALYGLLSRIRDLALPLISVNLMEGEGVEAYSSAN